MYCVCPAHKHSQKSVHKTVQKVFTRAHFFELKSLEMFSFIECKNLPK